MATGAGAIRAGRAFVELFADDSKLIAGLRKASAKLQSWGREVQGIGMKVFAGGAAVLTPLVAAAKTFMDTGSQMDRLSGQTGIAVEQLSALEYAAYQADIEFTQLTGSVAKMQRMIVKASGGGSAADSLAAIGLNAAKLRTMKPDEQLGAIADAISNIQDPAEASAAAMSIFGKGAASLLPLLKGGAGGIRALMAEAEALGLVMSAEDAAAAAEFESAIKRLWAQIRRLWFEIGRQVAPVLKGLASWVGNVVTRFKEWAAEHGDLIRNIVIVAGAVIILGSALVMLGVAIKIVGMALKGLQLAFSAVQMVISAVGALLSFLMTPVGMIVGAIVAVTVAILYFTGVLGKMASAAGRAFNTVKADATSAFKGIADALSAGNIPLAAEILWLLVKLEFQRGIAAIMKLWLGLKYGLANALLTAWYAAQAGLTYAWYGLEVAWTETIGFLSNAWRGFTGFIMDAWGSVQNWIAKRFVDLMGLFDKTLDTAAAKSGLDKNFEADQAKRKSAAAEARSRHEGRRAQQDADLRNTLEQIGADANQSIENSGRAYDAEIAAVNKKVQDAKARMDEAVKKAADGKAQKEKEKGKKGGALEAGIGKIGSIGTFNAMVAYALAGGGATDKLLAEGKEQTGQLKAINKNLEELQDQVEEAGEWA